MFIIESKITGEIVETNASNWRNALNQIKAYADYKGFNIHIKATNVINGLPYEDKNIKAYIGKLFYKSTI